MTVEADDNLLPLIETVVEGGILKIRPATRNSSISSRHLKIVVRANTIDRLSIAGSGDFEAAGRAASLHASIAGSGDVKAARLEAKNVEVRIAGSGDAAVWARETLEVKVAGSGDVKYYGDAVLKKSVLGSGSIKRLGAGATATFLRRLSAGYQI